MIIDMREFHLSASPRFTFKAKRTIHDQHYYTKDRETRYWWQCWQNQLIFTENSEGRRRRYDAPSIPRNFTINGTTAWTDKGKHLSMATGAIQRPEASSGRIAVCRALTFDFGHAGALKMSCIRFCKGARGGVI